ncbi:MAG: 6-bladed beta-propeller [Bacteroidales bacterium]|nr:6-bladed beta-propeller [Bacteroidales bacterium]
MVKEFNNLYAAFIAMGLFLLTGCTGNVSNHNDNRTYSIEEAMQNCQEICLSEYASDIAYIPLETKEESIIGLAPKFRAGNSNYYVYSSTNITVFDSNGKFTNLINNHGRGPKEYMLIDGFTIKEDNQISVISGSKILGYTLDGECVEALDLDTLGISNVSSCLFIKDGEMAVRTSTPNIDGKDTLGLFIIDSLLNIKNLGILGTESVYNWGIKGTSTTSGSLYSFKGCLRYLKSTGDTLVVYDDNYERLLCYTFDYGNYNPNDVVINNSKGLRINNVFETESFIKLILMGNKHSLQEIYANGNNDKFLSAGSLILDKATNKLKAMPYNYKYNAHGFVNDIDGGMPFDPVYYAGDKMYQMINADKFIEYATKSNSPQMKEIASTLTDESNPVLVVATLK